MRFIFGLFLGFGIGLAAALLMAPEKGAWRREEERPGEEGDLEERLGENHDAMAGLRRAMRGLQGQVQEAWEEARETAQEAEKELRARYERTLSKGNR